MIKTIIIDDEPLAAGLLQEYLSEYTDFEVLAVCHDGFQGLKAIQQYQPDLIFLDVQMPKISGFEMLELLEEIPAVIFTTAFDEYALQAFEVHATDYLLKPFSEARFNKAIEKYKQAGKGQNINDLLDSQSSGANEFLTRIVLKDRNDIKIIPTADIKYLEANDDYVNIYSGEGKFLKNKTLRYFESHLEANLFVRVHRSYLVKISEITKIEAYKKDSHIVILKNGERIPVSKTGYPKLKEALGI
jgi:two-component system LytT family response regulator